MQPQSLIPLQNISIWADDPERTERHALENWP